MKKHADVYIKKIEDHNDHEVWLVDGVLIRNELNDSFTEYGYHVRFPFIPQNEIWIEKDTNDDEWKYFLENVDFEMKGLAEGKKLEDVAEKADKAERRDRRQSPQMRKIIESHHERKEALEKIRKEKFDEYCNENITVWLINGEFVRTLYFSEYAYGGHDLVYDFVPQNEVWIEDVLEPKERKIILLHELHERSLMSGGKDYEHAHHGAIIVEAYYREHPEELHERLKEELAKNSS
ncbi:MAG: hypothetical protein WCT49_03050 [Candidatus Paceibacterota bacterium]|jgi:hypothetical protein|nr:hypothetical protein [Candidatus Paceibacterota bacterium]